MKNPNIQKSNAFPLCMAQAREAGRRRPERYLLKFEGLRTRRSEFTKFPIFWQYGGVSGVFPRVNQFLTEISETVKKERPPDAWSSLSKNTDKIPHEIL